jgi:glutathione S-transferase
VTDPYVVLGQNGSPYSMKIRAIMRYRRLRHVWDQRSARSVDEVAHVKPALMPMVKFPSDGGWRIDSTPIALELEHMSAERSIMPADPVHRFISDLIEDMADEWLTKAMFHYRWHYQEASDYAANWIASDNTPQGEGAVARRQQFASYIQERQVGRMALVGCTEENKPVIEESLRRVMSALESRVGYQSFLFGTRPSFGDFGLFGQLKTITEDPVGRSVVAKEAPTVFHWIRHTDDLSGLEGDWMESGAPLPAAITELLCLCGEAYLPFLAANRDATDEGAEELRLSIFGEPYAQAPFRYQLKCYSRLLALYDRLADADRVRLDPLLEKTNCLKWLRA